MSSPEEQEFSNRESQEFSNQETQDFSQENLEGFNQMPFSSVEQFGEESNLDPDLDNEREKEIYEASKGRPEGLKDDSEVMGDIQKKHDKLDDTQKNVISALQENWNEIVDDPELSPQKRDDELTNLETVTHQHCSDIDEIKNNHTEKTCIKAANDRHKKQNEIDEKYASEQKSRDYEKVKKLKLRAKNASDGENIGTLMGFTVIAINNKPVIKEDDEYIPIKLLIEAAYHYNRIKGLAKRFHTPQAYPSNSKESSKSHEDELEENLRKTIAEESNVKNRLNRVVQHVNEYLGHGSLSKNKLKKVKKAYNILKKICNKHVNVLNKPITGGIIGGAPYDEVAKRFPSNSKKTKIIAVVIICLIPLIAIWLVLEHVKKEGNISKETYTFLIIGVLLVLGAGVYISVR